MISNDTDKEWEKLGKHDPYFGVLTDEAYRKGNLNAEALELFFASGEAYVAEILERASRFAGPEFKPRTALDFGCGVGRLAIPLASRCERVVGVDVSPSMLREAEENCRRRGLANVEFHASLDSAAARGTFDFINSYIVFQHIPSNRGHLLFKQLVGMLAPRGVGAIHVTYRIQGGLPIRAVRWLRKRLQPVNALVNLADRKAPGSPFMQMNEYRMNEILWDIQAAGCPETLITFTNHEHAGAVLLFRKPPEARS